MCYLCFALAIAPSANEMCVYHKLFYVYSIWIFDQNEVHFGSCLMVMQKAF